MAFFSDENCNYLSLSLSPAGKHKAYVFRLKYKHIKTASSVVPILLYLSFVSFFSVVVIGVFGQSPFFKKILSDPQQTLVILLLSSFAAIVAFSEGVFFVWVRSDPSLLLNEVERKHLTYLRICKSLSWKAYAAFLFSLSTPIIGTIALPDGVDGFKKEVYSSGFGSNLIVFQVGGIGVFLAIFIVRRIYKIMHYEPQE